MNIYQKLNSIQTKLKANKGQYNEFGKYNYRSLEDINESVKPLLKNSSLVLILTDEPKKIGDRIYIKATATLINSENPEEVIKTTAYAREAEEKKGMDDSQITGACSSYARKYCLNGLFCIDDTKDADTMDNTKENKKAVKQDTPPENFIDMMKTYSRNQTQVYWGVLKNHGYDGAPDIPKKEQSKVLNEIQEKIGA